MFEAKLRECSRGYAIDVTDEQWERMKFRRRMNGSDDFESEWDIFEALEELGIYDIEWSGQSLYFKIDVANPNQDTLEPVDIQEILEQIVEIIS